MGKKGEAAREAAYDAGFDAGYDVGFNEGWENHRRVFGSRYDRFEDPEDGNPFVVTAFDGAQFDLNDKGNAFNDHPQFNEFGKTPFVGEAMTTEDQVPEWNMGEHEPGGGLLVTVTTAAGNSATWGVDDFVELVLNEVFKVG